METTPIIVETEAMVAEQELRDVLHIQQDAKRKVPPARISRALIDKLGIEDAKDIAQKILHEAHELQVSL